MIEEQEKEYEAIVTWFNRIMNDLKVIATDRVKLAKSIYGLYRNPIGYPDKMVLKRWTIRDDKKVDCAVIKITNSSIQIMEMIPRNHFMFEFKDHLYGGCFLEAIMIRKHV